MMWKLLEHYPKGWWPIGRSYEVGRESCVPLQALGQSFVLWRNAEGKLSLLEQYCPHMGADLSVTGKVCGETLQCGFHGLNFLVNGVADDTFSVNSFSVCEQDSVIYAWLGGAEGIAGEPTWRVPSIAGIFGKDLTLIDDEYDTAAPWIVFVGNGLDASHINYVHHGNTELDFAKWDYNIGPEPHQFSFTYSTSDDAVTVTHQFWGPTIAFSWIRIGQHEVRHYGASTPIDTNHTHLLLRYDAESEPRIMKYFREDILADIDVWESCRVQKPVYREQDALLRCFHQWLEQNV